MSESRTIPAPPARPPHHHHEPIHADKTRAWVEIDLGALQNNARAIRGRAGVPLLPMVKADAYGLGAIPVARALEEAVDPWGFGVGTLFEGIALRKAGITRPIVVFTPLLVEDLPGARAAGLTPTLDRAKSIETWCAIGGGAWHLAIDTGMSREGIRWDEAGTLAEIVQAHPPEGAYTHFHSGNREPGTNVIQEERFEAALAALGVRPSLLHCEASAAIERRERSRWTIVRPGIFLYGAASTADRLRAEPVISLRARIVDIRTVYPGDTVSYQATFQPDEERRIATLGIGYADGYRRAFTHGGQVLIRGVRAPVVGSVTMDMTMVDVTDISCEIGDAATLIGKDGRDVLELATVAKSAKLSPYELLAGLRMRVRHVYVGPDGMPGAEATGG